MFFKGINQGKQLENLRIIYSTAGMDYGEEYDVAVVGGGAVDNQPNSDNPGASTSDVSLVSIPEGLPYVAPIIDDEDCTITVRDTGTA